MSWRHAKSLFALACAVVCLLSLCPPPAAAQSAAPSETPGEHLGVGGTGAIGISGPMGSLRFSGPLSDRFGLDVDLGTARVSRQWSMAFATQLRWLRTLRRCDGSSDYFVFGVLLTDHTTRTEIRFPGETVISSDRRKRLSPQIGYGIDWQAPNGTRLSLEGVSGGGGEDLSPRVFARLSVVWGPEIRHPVRPCPTDK